MNEWGCQDKLGIKTPNPKLPEVPEQDVNGSSIGDGGLPEGLRGVGSVFWERQVKEMSFAFSPKGHKAS